MAEKTYTSQQVLDLSAKLVGKTIRTSLVIVVWALVWIGYGIIDDADHGTLIAFNLGLIAAAVIVGSWAAFARLMYWHAKETFKEEKKRADAALIQANVDQALRSVQSPRRATRQRP